MSGFDTATHLVYLAAAAGFVLGLHLMNSPATARRGNQLSATAMAAAVLVTGAVLIHDNSITATGVVVLIAGAAVGGAVGLYAARGVAMTAMPQLVSLFNAVGGGAAALLAVNDLSSGPSVSASVAVTAALDILIGTVTFTGSLVAAGKLQGWIPSQPLVFPGARALTGVLAAGFVASGCALVATPTHRLPLILLLVAGLGFGVTMVLPIGGADMPVVISLLNAFTGTAVAMAGFVLANAVLIIAGALVGASGTILTKLMADAMNRSIPSIIVGGFGTGDTAPVSGTGNAHVREVSADDVAIQLAYASKVMFVPGYGLAAAQAQHQLAELAALLEQRGIEVGYAIHPVAGRMPGHMNVLLAEANVPYPQLQEMDEANPEFARTDVALVVGANDVTNPVARRPGNPISGMPILDVDQARAVVVIKRSMGHGYAGIDNELYTDPKTGMLFADARKGITDLTAAVKTLVA
ncbi:NAD(P)(+) transhydrogenase (Re/Si-specific) subunit beta [Rugosimonospora africana]|uniref:NAD(P) transhydrogenase subunit beta n=1 Tax=Rugosimonospora africana TaxID=556532 RepID=A0A8J3R0E5_9ACTN|nr:NAD(P)(+) transhydrogenase (Re/Si-specific) subunit beta [Rugosimonospora africana]GIH17931.1 NAD(P) transhydrogenase subunit beta [Rugosimonospora africana]